MEPASATNVASQAKLGFDELAADLQDSMTNFEKMTIPSDSHLVALTTLQVARVRTTTGFSFSGSHEDDIVACPSCKIRRGDDKIMR